MFVAKKSSFLCNTHIQSPHLTFSCFTDKSAVVNRLILIQSVKCILLAVMGIHNTIFEINLS